MKKLQHQNIQHQIANLITIIELYLPVIEEINKAQSKLNFLPNELEKLRKLSEILKQETVENSDRLPLHSESEFPIDETEFQIDSLVNDLEEIFIYLNTFENKLKNILSLEERLEAIQEERIKGITPERIYKLLEQQQSREIESAPKTRSFKDFWQKIVHYRHTKKIAVSTAIFVGTIFFTAYNSSTEPQVIESTIIEKTPTSDNSTTGI